jgi:hypothetical protein
MNKYKEWKYQVHGSRKKGDRGSKGIKIKKSGMGNVIWCEIIERKHARMMKIGYYYYYYYYYSSNGFGSVHPYFLGLPAD